MKRCLFLCLLLCASCKDTPETGSAFPGRGDAPRVASVTRSEAAKSVTTRYGYDRGGRITRLVRESYANGSSQPYRTDTYRIVYSNYRVRIYGKHKETSATGHVGIDASSAYTLDLNRNGYLESGSCEIKGKFDDGTTPAIYQDMSGTIGAGYLRTGEFVQFSQSRWGTFYDENDPQKRPMNNRYETTDCKWTGGAIASLAFDMRTDPSPEVLPEWKLVCTFEYTEDDNTTNTDFTDTQDNLFFELGLTGANCPKVPKRMDYAASVPESTDTDTIHFIFDHELDPQNRIRRVTRSENGGQPVVWEFTYAK